MIRPRLQQALRHAAGILGLALLLGPFPSGITLPSRLAFGADATPYRIATVAWAGWSPLHIAHEKGIWAALGVDVEVVNYDDPIVILEAIRAGRIDFAMDMAGTLVGVHMDGRPLTVLAETNWSHGGDRIIVKQGDSLHNHRGGAIGLFLDRPSCLYFLGLYLQQQGLRLSDFRIVEINPEDMVFQFVLGRLPVIVSYDPWALQAIYEGDGMCLATSADFEGCIPECMWAYTDRLKIIPEDDVRRVLRGWIHAVRWMKDPDNCVEVVDILNRRTFSRLPPKSGEEMGELLSGVRIHGPDDLVERNRVNGGLYGYLRSLRAFLAENNRLQRRYRVADIVDNRFIMEALALEGFSFPDD